MDKPLALIIEDERDIAALFRHVLDMAGFRTQIALHGLTAMEMLQTIRPDLILLDLRLPGVSGDKILRSIREDERLKDSKVIVTTGHAEIAEGLPAEADLILLKPVNMEQLSTVAKRYLLTMNNDKTIPIQGQPWDPATGLYNRLFFTNRLDSALSRMEEVAQYHFAVMAITLDQNGSMRNLWENERWTAVLKETATTLRSVVRPTDTIARFDQDNFYILIEDVPNKDIPRQIAARLRNQLTLRLAASERAVRFPIRIGIILCDHGYKDVEQVLHDVNEANALASSAGEFFYDPFEKPVEGK